MATLRSRIPRMNSSFLYSSPQSLILPQIRLLSTSHAMAPPLGLIRLKEHYNNTLAEDIQLLTYDHSTPPPRQNPAIPPPLRTRKGNLPLKPVRPAKIGAATIPQLQKIEISTHVRDSQLNKNHLLSAILAFQSVTGVRPELVYARKSVAQWKLREGDAIGCKVTLKGHVMYTFLDKLVETVLPRLKEWQGLPALAGDGNGNIGMGFPPTALALFPEIEGNFDMYPRMTGFHVMFCTTAYTDKEGRLVLSGLQVPFAQS